jgi:hypothetical protein
MTTLSARDEYSVAIAAGEKLTITSSVSSTGYVDRWRGSTNLGRTVITASQTLVFGPYLFGMRFNVVCQTGSISFSSADENSAINDAEFIEFKQDAPLAQSIPLSEDLGLFTHPFRFGAVGDGVTDDKLALQRCLSYAMTVGAEVNLYNKLYACSGKLFVNGAQPIYWHDGNIKAVGTSWGGAGLQTGAFVEVRNPTDSQLGNRIENIFLDCNYIARTGWYLRVMGPRTIITSNHAVRFLDYGIWAKGDPGGNNDVNIIGCTASEATPTDTEKYNDYSLRTGIAFFVDTCADITFTSCIGSASKHGLKVDGDFWNFKFVGGQFWNSAAAKDDPTSITAIIGPNANRGQFIGTRFDDGAVKLYNFNHRFIGCEFIQYALAPIQLVATAAAETAANLTFIGNTLSDINDQVSLLTEGDGTWGTVACEWSNNIDSTGAPVAIQDKSLITAGLTIENGNVNLSGDLHIDGVKVLGNRITGYGDFTNGAKTGFDATTATLPQVAAAVAQLITDFKTQGSIGA